MIQEFFVDAKNNGANIRVFFQSVWNANEQALNSSSPAPTTTTPKSTAKSTIVTTSESTSVSLASSDSTTESIAETNSTSTTKKE
jgi:hypothetical protein